MNKAIAVLLITVMALSFAACAKKGDATVEKVVGTWRVNAQATLNGQAATEAFTYTLENGIMIMEFRTETDKFHCKVDCDRMIFVRNGSDLVLDRK